MNYLKIKSWSSYQSYKDRTPPWIRFHKSLLDDFEYQSMSADARALLPMLWLLASEDSDPKSGLIKDKYEKIAFRLRLPIEVLKTSLCEIITTGFIEEIQQCSDPVTEPYSIRNETVTPETETETETETEEDTCIIAGADDTSAQKLNSIVSEKSKEVESQPSDQKINLHSEEPSNPYPIAFQQCWKAYPKRHGGNSKSSASRAWKARVRAGDDPDELLTATKNYHEHCRRNNIIGKRFVKMASTFYGPDEHWRQFLVLEAAPPESKHLGAFDVLDHNQRVVDAIINGEPITDDLMTPIERHNAAVVEQYLAGNCSGGVQ